MLVFAHGYVSGMVVGAMIVLVCYETLASGSWCLRRLGRWARGAQGRGSCGAALGSPLGLMPGNEGG